MAVKLNSTGGGSVTLDSPSTASNYTVTLPSAAGTVATASGTTFSNSSITAANSNTVEATSGPTSTQLSGNRNKIINGAMMIDQRNAGASVTGVNGSAFVVDRFGLYGTAASKLTAQQNAGSVSPPAGFTNYLGVTSSSAYSVSSSDYFSVAQPIEGFNFCDLAFGTSSAKTVTLSFWVYSSLTGSFGGSLQNYAEYRCYAFSYSIPSANTWTYITVTIPGDTAGTWVGASNAGSAWVWFGLGAGSTRTGSAGSWGGQNLQPTGTVSVVGTSGATWYVTGVQLEKGATATPFENRLYGTELALCQRYYEKNYNIDVAPGSFSSGLGLVDVTVTSNSSSLAVYQIPFAVTKRAAPSMTGYRNTGTSGQWTYERSGVGGTAQTIGFGAIGTATTYAYINVGVTWAACEIYGFWVASAEL